MAILIPMQGQQNVNRNVQYQSLLPTLQGGNFYENSVQTPQPQGGVFSLQNYQPPSLPGAMNQSPTLQLKPYNSDPRLQSTDGQINFLGNYSSLPGGNNFMRLSAETQPPTSTTSETAPTQTTPQADSMETAAKNAAILVDGISASQPKQQTFKLFETPEKVEGSVKNYADLLRTIPEGFYQKINSQPLLKGEDLNLGKEIFQTKANYLAIDEMVKGIDEELANGDLSAEDRKKFIAAKADYQKQLSNLNQYVEFLRNVSGSNVNWADYGLSSQDNLAKSQAALYNQEQRGSRQFLNLV